MSTTNHEPVPESPQQDSSVLRRSPRAWLWASAFVLAALLLMQINSLTSAGGRPDLGQRAGASAAGFTFDPTFASAALAGDVARVGDQTMLTFNAGDDDVLAVVDSRAEQMLVYRIRNRTSFELLGVYSLPELFVTGQRVGSGVGRGR
ncbi:MAG TPA: hypothetical protein PL072_05245 [Phycisphaerales bacterium]|nr:hypothetical protein [Phycisphaerales bacterium]